MDEEIMDGYEDYEEDEDLGKRLDKWIMDDDMGD